jgi:hypothetical protein
MEDLIQNADTLFDERPSPSSPVSSLPSDAVQESLHIVTSPLAKPPAGTFVVEDAYGDDYARAGHTRSERHRGGGDIGESYFGGGCVRSAHTCWHC